MKKLFFILLMPCTLLHSQVLIFTYAYNRPDFIEIQWKTFKKFLKDDYELVVFNDARHHAMAMDIQNMCDRYAIRCVRIPQEIHNKPYLQRWPGEDFNHPSVRNSNVVQYSLHEMGFKHDDILILIDSDMFLIKEFSVREYLNGNMLAGYKQLRGDRDEIVYLWIGLVFLDFSCLPNKTILNFNCGRVDTIPVDAGGHIHYYLKNNPLVPVKFFSHEENFTNDFHFKQGITKEVSISNQSIFCHYAGGSNWKGDSGSYLESKTHIFNSFMSKVLAE